MTSQSNSENLVVQNRRARHDFHVLDHVEAGIVLLGEEMKSIRAGEITLTESYVKADKGELFLVNAYIRKYSHSGNDEYDPLRPRKLLLHRREIDRLVKQVNLKGFTLIPLDIHLKDGRAKVEVAVCKGKSAPDKRSAVKERDAKRDMARALKG